MYYRILIKNLSAIAVFFSMSCRENESKQREYYEIVTGTTHFRNIRSRDYMDPISNVKIALYQNLEDYLYKSTPIYEGETNENGILQIPSEHFPPPIYIEAQVSELNNLRFQDFLLPERKEVIQTPFKTYTVIPVRLSTCPTRLRIKILTPTELPSDYVVQLYLSEEDYFQDIAPEVHIEYINKTYGSFDLLDKGQQPSKIFRKHQDGSGEFSFSDLDTKTYWFSLKDVNGNRVPLSHNRTNTELPNNPNIITQIDTYLK